MARPVNALARTRDNRDVPAPILVVDDREDSLLALRAVLEPLGQPVVTARSGDEALRHLLRNQVAVILLDVNMPGLDGFSTAAMIKRRERTRDIPIIFLTADSDASERGQVQLGYSAGAVDFLVKPYDPWTLVSKVTVFIELHRHSEQLRRQVDELQASEAALSEAQRIARLAHFRVEPATGAIAWSEYAIQLFGPQLITPNARMTPFPFWDDLVNPDPARDFDQLHRQWIAGDGTSRTLVGRVEFGHDRAGRVRSISGTLQDITEQAETRRALVATTDLLQREKETATLLQAALLPKVLPEAPGLDLAATYLPADVGVGGDWYDASIQPDGKVLLAIGDVAGHGIAAATTMNEIRIASRAFSLNESSPSRILHMLNNFCRGTRRGNLVTALIVLLDPVTGEATVASAGHLPPVVAHGGQAYFVDLHVTPPLGVSVAHAEETQVVLPPGATILLYTDGLVEQRRGSIDDRLAQLADLVRAGGQSAAAIVDDVVRRMLPTGPPADDVALIAVKRSTDRTLRIEMPAESSCLAPIRALMRRWLAMQGANTDETRDIVLAVGELASNACTHASPVVEGTLTVEARRDGDVLRVTVSDQGRWRPPLDRGGGRGLPIVRAVVDSLSIDSDDHGTRAHLARALASPLVEAEAT